MGSWQGGMPPKQPPALATAWSWEPRGASVSLSRLGWGGGGSQHVFGLSCVRFELWAGSFSESHFFLPGGRKLSLNRCRWEIAGGNVSGLWLSPEAPRKTRRGKWGMQGGHGPHHAPAGGRFTGPSLALSQLPGSFPLAPTASNSTAGGAHGQNGFGCDFES